jgi:sugar lactone lactonase YvrE
MSISIFSDMICALGEGPPWNPEQRQVFWFDILSKWLSKWLSKRLFTRSGDGEWHTVIP